MGFPALRNFCDRRYGSYRYSISRRAGLQEGAKLVSRIIPWSIVVLAVVFLVIRMTIKMAFTQPDKNEAEPPPPEND